MLFSGKPLLNTNYRASSFSDIKCCPYLCPPHPHMAHHRGGSVLQSRASAQTIAHKCIPPLYPFQAKDETDKVGTMLLEELNRLLARESASGISQAERTKQVHKVMNVLQAGSG